MSLSVHEIVVPTMILGLGVMDDYVDHAARFAAAKMIPISEILDTRLAPDMLSFAEQIAVLCNKVQAHASKLARRDMPAPVKLLQTSAAQTEHSIERQPDLVGQTRFVVAQRRHIFGN